jgi:MarR family transcriptional regulator for hemolysin
MPVQYRNFGFLLKELGRLYTKRYEERARSFGLTLMQCKALVHLAKNEGASQKGLCELSDIEPMAMVRIVDRMAADGWIVRESDPLDRRAHRLRTTPKSKPVYDRIWEIADETRNEFMGDLTAAERRAFMGLLERIHATVLALGPVEEPTSPPTRPGPVRTVRKTSSPRKPSARRATSPSS